jgi:hypothetical protein
MNVRFLTFWQASTRKRRNTLKNLGLEKEVDVIRIQITSQVTKIDAALLTNSIM